METIRQSFNELPGTVKVILYSGISQMLGVLLVMVNDATPFDWRKLVAIPLGVGINIVAYLILREKNNGEG